MNGVRPTDHEPDDVTPIDVCVIGVGQSGLAVGYHLSRLTRRDPAHRDLSFVILDDHPRPGGAWQDAWDSLRLFSPAGYSSLPGWPMPPWRDEGNPDAHHVAAYLRAYEERYELSVRRPTVVTAVRRAVDGRFIVETENGPSWSARWVINATGTWRQPFWPHVPGMATFAGRQLHTADYRGAADFAGRRVLVVGGGNSAAQIAADLLATAEVVTWVAKDPPRMLPDDVDGRVLFETATRAVRDRAAGIANDGVAGLGDIVVVPSVRYARDHLDLRAEAMIERLTPEGAAWPDGRRGTYDAVIWCTGFRPALRHLAPLGLSSDHGHPTTVPPDVAVHSSPGTPSPVVAVDDRRVFFVGYGDWCGSASATLIGVNRSARDAVAAIAAARDGG